MLRAALYPLRLVGCAARPPQRPGAPRRRRDRGGCLRRLRRPAGTTVAQDRAVAQAIERIPDGSRSVRAVWFGLPGIGDEPQPVLERRARRALAGAGAGSATSLVLFRETTIAGSFAGLGGVEQLGRWVRSAAAGCRGACTPGALRGAAAPRERAGCRSPTACGSSRSAPPRSTTGSSSATSSRRPTTRSRTPRSARRSPPRPATTGPPPPPLFLAKGVESARARRPRSTRIYRSYAWVSPLEPGSPRLWEIDRLAAGVTRARSELQAVSTSFDLIAPVEELRAAQSASRAAGRRLGLVAGEAAALLFAFAILAALTLRRDLRAARRRLAWFGARGWQLALLTAAETGALALAGTAIGFGSRRRSAARRSRGGPARRRARCSSRASSRRGGSYSRVAGRRRRGSRARRAPSRPGRRGFGRVPFSPLDAAALAALALVVYGLMRGDANGDLVLLLPGLVTFAAAVVVARLLAAGAAAGGAARARALARAAARVALARPEPRLRDRRDGVPRRQLRPRALRGELPRDARARRARPGRAPGAARLRAAGGSAAADPGARRRPARALPRARRPSRSRPSSACAAGSAGSRARAGSRCSACRRRRSRACTAGARSERGASPEELADADRGRRRRAKGRGSRAG